MYDIIVIGGGPAGVIAALRARELGAKVALVERDRMGGICTNDGCVPTRVLAKAARLVRDSEQYGQYGLTGERPTVNLAELIARAQGTVYRVHEKKQLLDNLRQTGVEVWDVTGQTYFIDEFTIGLGDGRLMEAEKFIICAGGHARRISFLGSEYALTHSDVWKLQKLPKSVAIVGGAATGCQLASILTSFGSEVTILDVAPTILSAEDQAVCNAMTDAFGRCDIQIITQIDGVDRIEQHQGGLRLFYSLGKEMQTLDVEAVIMAVGWVGNIEGMNLDLAGVKTDHGYILVDDSLQTSAAHIFAAGDITGRMMLVQSATYEGRIAAENAILHKNLSFEHAVVPHGGFTDPEYGSVGLTESQAATQSEYAVTVVPYADLDRAVIDGRTDGFCKMIVSPKSGLVLGTHVVGEQAVEVVQIAAASMAGEVDFLRLAELELAYPTFTAIIGLAARRLVHQLNLSPIAPVWRALSRVERRPAEWEMQGS